MANPFTSKLTPKNEAKDQRRPVDEARSGNLAEDGYAVLDRGNPESLWDRNRKGLAPPVRHSPNIDYSEDY